MKRIIPIAAFLLIIAVAIYLTCFNTFVGRAFYSQCEYKLVQNWPQLPNNLHLGNPTGLDLDTDQNLVVFHRGLREWPLLLPMPKTPIQENTILVLDRITGQLIRSWGKGLFVMPHGLTVDRHNNVWVTDVGLHQIFKFNSKGELLLKLGEPGVSGNDTCHFNKPTDVAVANDGCFYVSDGYGNSRIVKFSAAGKYLLQWGKHGNKQGEFDIPHAINLDTNGNVYVADRENSRVQIFSSKGNFLNQWSNNDWGNLCSIAYNSKKNRFIAVDDVMTFKVKHNGSDIISLDSVGNQLSKFGRSGFYNGTVSWYHDVCIDNDGNIYVGDILGNRLQKFRSISLNK